MALDCGIGVLPADNLVTEIKGGLRHLKDQLLSWQAGMNATGTLTSGLTEQIYQSMASQRKFVEDNQNSPGLKEAYLRQNPSLPPDYAPGVEWQAVKLALEDLMTTIRNTWPEKSAKGYPAYKQWDAVTFLHVDFTVPAAGAQQAALNTKIIAVTDKIV